MIRAALIRCIQSPLFERWYFIVVGLWCAGISLLVRMETNSSWTGLIVLIMCMFLSVFCLAAGASSYRAGFLKGRNS